MPLAFVLVFTLGLVAQEAAPDPAPAVETPPADTATSAPSDDDAPVSTGAAFLLKLKQGGGTMVFLLICSVITVGCAAERTVKQRKGRIAPRGLTDKARALWSDGKFDEIEALGAKNGSTLGRMLAAIARYRETGGARVSTIAGDIASRDLKRHIQGAFPLAVVATLAPLLGLFGTVLGMIGAFDKIALMGELANPSAFGGDIGKALITTGAGLAVAIASLALYHWFKGRVGGLGLELEEEVSMLIADWFDKPATTKAEPTPAPASAPAAPSKIAE